MTAAFLHAANRTPFGRFGGALADVRPDDLAAAALSGLLARVPDLDPARIGDVVWGNANGAGEDNRNVGRMAVLLAGLPTSVPATTVNRLCGSSLDAAMMASRSVESGDAEVVVVGGVESMTRAPWVMAKPGTPWAKPGEVAGPLLAMGPAANWVGKVWPIERFAQTAGQLLGPDGPMAGGRLLILGGPEDTRMVEELRMASARGRCVDLTGKVDLLTAYACLKRADLFIGNDSGLMHIAAAAGTPTIGLFGPSDERRYAPWGLLTRAVRGPRAFEQFLAVDPDLSQAIRHMSDLPVATVVKAAKALLVEAKTAGQAAVVVEAESEPVAPDVAAEAFEPEIILPAARPLATEVEEAEPEAVDPRAESGPTP